MNKSILEERIKRLSDKLDNGTYYHAEQVKHDRALLNKLKEQLKKSK